MTNPIEVVDAKRPAAEAAQDGSPKRQKRLKGKLPVSTLCGFLGAGKTTLLKHILESKKAEAFKCAVIVNDMAELNIDASLIDQSALVQSEDVIAMQNGCICCTLQNDLVTQITTLAKKDTFDYMVIEASGVSEPSQIGKLFADCEEDHDHDHEHGSHDQLSELSYLDTCATVVDTSDFFNKFEMINQGPKHESFPQLLVEQIEYANVVVLNKTDLVSKDQLAKVSEQVSILNPKAKVLTARNSKIDVAEVVNSGLYKAGDFTRFHDDTVEKEEEEVKPCCKDSMLKGESACCRGKRTHNSGKSKVVIGYAGPKLNKESGKATKSRHSSRFAISSFIYQSRRPFHPERFNQLYIDEFFVVPELDEWQEEEEGAAAPQSKGHGKGGKKKEQQEGEGHGQENGDAEKEEKNEEGEDGEAAVREQQRVAKEKQTHRTEKLGDLFRSKGFIWLANNHDHMGVLGQAGSVMKIEFPERWKVLQWKSYQGLETATEEEKAAGRKDWVETWGDRRQDLVLIGKDLKVEAIQELLDSCLLTDEEMALGADGWKACFGDSLLDWCA